jgi:predicted transcriptional regulator of viral defense system
VSDIAVRRAEPGPPTRELADWLISHGQHWVTLAQVSELLTLPPEQVPPIMARLRRNGKVFSPLRGAYVPIPPEYRSWRAVPASHFIDPLMAHLGHSYYVGLLSAAEIHGAAHQRPQIFQVVTTGRLRDRGFGRVKIEFVSDARSDKHPVMRVNTPTGTMNVSTPEVTLLDLVASPPHGGGLSNVATVAGELLQEGRLDARAFADAASTYPISVIQRTGWLLDEVAAVTDTDIDTEALAALARRRVEPTPLSASGKRAGPIDERWNVRLNTTVEPDL